LLGLRRGSEGYPTCLEAPKGEKRPADVIGNAVHVMRIDLAISKLLRGDQNPLGDVSDAQLT